MRGVSMRRQAARSDTTHAHNLKKSGSYSRCHMVVTADILELLFFNNKQLTMSVNSEEVDNIICFICEKDLENDSEEPVVVVKRGIETLKTVSIERKDERHKILEGREAIKVHVKCREKYNMKRGGKLDMNTLLQISMLRNLVLSKKTS